jgi:hypothetical protein
MRAEKMRAEEVLEVRLFEYMDLKEEISPCCLMLSFCTGVAYGVPSFCHHYE